MLLRYHWGLGIGHTYSDRGPLAPQSSTILEPAEDVGAEGDSHNCDEGPRLARDVPELEANNLEGEEGWESEDSGGDSDSGVPDSDREDLEGDQDEELQELTESYYANY
jgi:hypothetical protein